MIICSFLHQPADVFHQSVVNLSPTFKWLPPLFFGIQAFQGTQHQEIQSRFQTVDVVIRYMVCETEQEHLYK